MRHAVKQLLILLNKTPLKILAKAVYTIVIFVLVTRLRRIPEIKLIALTGSLCDKDPLFFHSDIDLFLLVDCSPERRLLIVTTIESKMKKGKMLCPFLGTVQERMSGVYFLDDVRDAVHVAPMTFKMKTSLYKELYRHEDLDLRGSNLPYTHEEVLEELKSVLKQLFSACANNSLTHYLVKSKLRNILLLCPDELEGSVRLRDVLLPADFSYLQAIIGRSSVSAYYAPFGDGDKESIGRILSALIGFLLNFYEFDVLETYDITVSDVSREADAYVDSPCCLYLNPREYTDWFQEGHMQGDEVVAVFPLHEVSSVSAVSGNLFLRSRFFAVHFLSGECKNVFSIYERPELFASRRISKDKIRCTRYFYDLAQHELNRVTLLMKEAYEPVVDAIVRKERSLGYFLNVDRMFYSFFVIHLFHNFSEKKWTVIRHTSEIFDDLRGHYPQHCEMFSLLKEYYQYMKEGRLQDEGHVFPPNLIPAARSFFAHYLLGKEWSSSAAVNTRLTVSLCVCTKNRDAYLAELLESIVTQTRLPDELLIIDNMSTDDTAAVVDQFRTRLPIRYFSDNAKSIPALRNRALSEAHCDIVSFTDDDCVLDKNWLYFVEESFLRDDTIGAVGGSVHHYSDATDSALDYFHQEYLGVKY